MIEVFKTSVTDREVANMLLDQIHLTFIGYQANFDLEDCDKILRVCFDSGIVQPSLIISLLKYFKYEAEILLENTSSPIEKFYWRSDLITISPSPCYICFYNQPGKVLLSF